jgi:hypothetical protein
MNNDGEMADLSVIFEFVYLILVYIYFVYLVVERKVSKLHFFCHCEGGTTEAISLSTGDYFVVRSSLRVMTTMI